MSNTSEATITDTQGLLCMIKDARGRNRSVHEDIFVPKVDPEGTHLVSLNLHHNQDEMRALFLCKMKDEELPTHIWLDMGLDVFEQCTETVEIEL